MTPVMSGVTAGGRDGEACSRGTSRKGSAKKEIVDKCDCSSALKGERQSAPQTSQAARSKRALRELCSAQSSFQGYF